MKKVVIAIAGLIVLVGVCYGTVWYFNKDKRIEGPNDNLTDTINDRFTPFEDMSTTITEFSSLGMCLIDAEGYNPNENYPSKIHINNGKILFDYIFDLKSIEAKGISGTPKKLIYVSYVGGGTEYFAVLTEEGEVYIDLITFDCSNPEDLVTFTKVKTPSKVLDITSRSDLPSVINNGSANDLYVYLETKELRIVEYNYNNTFNATVGKRWGELYPQMDSFEIDNTNYIFNIFDDRSISLYSSEWNHNINLNYNKKNIEVGYIYENYHDVGEENLNNIIYISDTQNNLYKLEVDNIDYKQNSYELILIDRYNKIEIKELENNYVTLLNKDDKSETINIYFDFYQFHVKNDYETIYE